LFKERSWSIREGHGEARRELLPPSEGNRDEDSPNNDADPMRKAKLSIG